MTEEQKPELKKKANSNGAKNAPEHVIRDGGVAAMIWRRESTTGFPYYEFSLSRSWKSVSSGKTGYSQNFFSRNEPQLVKVIELASKWISEKEPQSQVEPLAA